MTRDTSATELDLRAALLRDLAVVLADPGIGRSASTPTAPAPARRRRGSVGTAFAIALLLVGGSLLTGRLVRDAVAPTSVEETSSMPASQVEGVSDRRIVDAAPRITIDVPRAVRSRSMPRDVPGERTSRADQQLASTPVVATRQLPVMDRRRSSPGDVLEANAEPTDRWLEPRLPTTTPFAGVEHSRPEVAPLQVRYLAARPSAPLDEAPTKHPARRKPDVARRASADAILDLRRQW